MSDDASRADQVEELALACLEHLTTEGDSAVDRVCGDHPELAARVRGVLRQLQSVGLVTPPALEPVRELGDFRLLRKLGEGGMGVVWLAEQRSLGRRVALKLLRPGQQLQDRLRERFRREVHALSRLDHPNICTVYEAGEVEGTPYLAMRYVEGESLAHLLEQRRRERAPGGSTTRATSSRELLDLVQMVEKVAHALQAAHAAGVVHRDVKPGNVLIDASGEPVLVDFGLAHDDDPALSVLTVSGEPLGTPAYMAPEQVSGQGPIDRRTDVYALGAMLYECATLRTPFQGPSRDSLYRSILHDPLPDPRKSNRAVGRELRAVLEKALEKEPRRRFATAAELAEELSRIQRHEPVRTRSAGPVLRTVRWCQRNRAATVVLAVVSVALVVSLLALQRSEAAEKRFRALALIAAAEEVEQENPVLAFKLGRAALLLQDPADVDPLVVSRVQQTMFQLRGNTVIRKEEGRLEWVKFSPMGRFLVVSGIQCSPTLHRGDDGELIYPFPHVMPLQKPAIAFSPSGDALAIGDDAGLVHVYDLRGSLPASIASFGPEADTVIARVAWSRDGGRLVLGHKNGSASVWTRNGVHLRELPAVDETIEEDGDPWWGVAFLPDGHVVAAGAIWSADLDACRRLEHEGEVESGVTWIGCTETRLLTERTGRPGARLWDHEGRFVYTTLITEQQKDVVIHTSFDRGGRRFAISFSDGSLELRSADDGEFLDVFRNDRVGATVKFSFSRDDDRIAMANFAGSIQILDIDSGMTSPLTGHLGQVVCVDFSPQGNRVASASWDGTARVWELDEPVPGVPQVLLTGFMPDIEKASNGQVVAAGSGEVLLCDPGGNVLRRGTTSPGWSSLGVAPGGTKVVIGSTGGSIWTWDLDVPDQPILVVDVDEPIWDCDFLADGRILLWSLRDQRVYLLDQLTLSPVSPPGTSRMTVSEDGKNALLGTFDGKWQLLSLQDGSLVQTASGQAAVQQAVIGLGFAAEQTHALVGTFAGEVTRWDLATEELLDHHDDHRHAVFSVEASPNGRRIASASIDGTVRVLDIDRRGAALVLKTRNRDAFFKALWLDDQRLVTVSADAVRWWWVDAEGLREAIGVVPIKSLTESEEERYSHLLGL